MKIFNFFKKKNKNVVIDGKNVIINDICINEVFSECITRLDEVIKEQNIDNLKAIRDGLEQIQKELELDGNFIFDSNNCIYVNSGNNSNNINSCIANNINSTAFFSSVVTNIGDGKNKVKVKQSSFFNKGNMVGGNIVISQNNINGDNFFDGRSR